MQRSETRCAIIFATLCTLHCCSAWVVCVRGAFQLPHQRCMQISSETSSIHTSGLYVINMEIIQCAHLNIRITHMICLSFVLIWETITISPNQICNESLNYCSIWTLIYKIVILLPCTIKCKCHSIGFEAS